MLDSQCDGRRPGCSQCAKSGWICPGYIDPPDITFRNETQLLIEKARKDKNGPCESAPPPKNENFIRSLSPGLTDRGTAFFVHQYVSSGANDSNTSMRGNHEYLPKLLCSALPSRAARTALETVTAAAGLAGLANSSGSQTLVPEAYRLYGSAIRQIQLALRDPLQVHSDETLAAVMLMGTFEIYHGVALPRLFDMG